MNYGFRLYVFMSAAFLGFELICGLSPLLHRPLTALTNAIASTSVVGAIPAGGEDYAPPALARAGVCRGRGGHHQPGQRVSHHGPHALKMFRKRGSRKR
jgi:hypothetical protein